MADLVRAHGSLGVTRERATPALNGQGAALQLVTLLASERAPAHSERKEPRAAEQKNDGCTLGDHNELEDGHRDPADAARHAFIE